MSEALELCDKRIKELLRQNADLQEANTRLLLDNRRLKSELEAANKTNSRAQRAYDEEVRRHYKSR